jgi:alpha-glucosidase
VLVYVRETAEESVLLLAARADVDLELELPVGETLYGSVTITRLDATTRFTATGPVFGAWTLPSPQLPPF